METGSVLLCNHQGSFDCFLIIVYFVLYHVIQDKQFLGLLEKQYTAYFPLVLLSLIKGDPVCVQLRSQRCTD